MLSGSSAPPRLPSIIAPMLVSTASWLWLRTKVASSDPAASSVMLHTSSELGADFAAAGQWWADRVAAAWEAEVRSSFASIQTEAERLAGAGNASQ